VLRGKASAMPLPSGAPRGQWIWAYADAGQSPAGETFTFRKTWRMATAPRLAWCVITCDNSYVLYVNGQRVEAGENWGAPDVIVLSTRLKAGENEIVITGKNAGDAPNPAGLYFEARLVNTDDSVDSLATDDSWAWTAAPSDGKGKFAKDPGDW